MLVKCTPVYTHLSSTVYKRDILLEIVSFFYPLAFNAPVGGVPIGIAGKSLVLRKLESWGYQASEDSLTIG